MFEGTAGVGVESTRRTEGLYESFRQRSTIEEQRLQLLCDTYDAVSVSRLARVTIPRDALCVDIGAGLATIAAYLCARCGPAAQVVATEVAYYSTRREADNLEHLEHRLGTTPLPVRGADLIYARGVLNVLPDRRPLLADLAAALKPGGMLMIETFDFDASAQTAPWTPSYIYELMLEMGARAQLEVAWGPRLAGDLQELGLQIVLAESTAPFVGPNTPGREYWAESLRLVEPFICRTPADCDYRAALRMLSDDAGVVVLPKLTGVIGRRP